MANPRRRSPTVTVTCISNIAHRPLFDHGCHTLRSQRLLFQISPEVENDLDRPWRLPVFVEAIHIALQLATVPEDLLSALLEGDFHVARLRRTNVRPKDEL